MNLLDFTAFMFVIVLIAVIVIGVLDFFFI